MYFREHNLQVDLIFELKIKQVMNCKKLPRSIEKKFSVFMNYQQSLQFAMLTIKIW